MINIETIHSTPDDYEFPIADCGGFCVIGADRNGRDLYSINLYTDTRGDTFAVFDRAEMIRIRDVLIRELSTQ